VNLKMASLAERDLAHLIHPLTEPRHLAAHGPRLVVSGDGWWITDDRGRRLIDGFAGLWCVNVGHGRPEIIEAVRAQMETLEYFTTFHGQSHPKAVELAEKLASMFPKKWGLDHVMFSSGGSEANETNIKLVRLYWALKGEHRRVAIIARHHGYHGLTIATMTATGIMPLRWNFGPEAPGFELGPAPYCYRCELGLAYPECKIACVTSLAELIERVGPDTVAAIMAEPIIGSSGIIPPPPEYFPMLREICDRYGIPLILDEVVTAFGRTGKMFGFEHWNVRPDLVTLAKGLTSGYLPMGASVVSHEIWSTISERLPDYVPLSHGFTYMGHPVCCAAALANIDIIEREDLPANAARVGTHLLERARELQRFDSVGEVRGIGLMVGIELVTDRESKRGFSLPHSACTRVETEAWERGLSCRAMGTEVVGLAPPLTIDVETADRMIEILADSIEAMERDMLGKERARASASGRISASAEFFEKLLPSRFDAEAAKDLDLVVQFVLDGPEAAIWVLSIRDGAFDASRIAEERSDAAATIRSSAADFVKLVNGDLSGADAFSSQRLTVDGDLGAAARLMTLGIM